MKTSYLVQWKSLFLILARSCIFTDFSDGKKAKFLLYDFFFSDLKSGSKIYLKDLGPQIGWSTVFLCEYAGPLFTYLIFYPRPSLIYGAAAATQKYADVVQWVNGFLSISFLSLMLTISKWITVQGMNLIILMYVSSSRFQIQQNLCNKDYWLSLQIKILMFLFSIIYKKFEFLIHQENKSLFKSHCAQWRFW